MIGKKMLMWIGAGLFSVVAIPAMAVTAHHVVTKAHAKLAHGGAHATSRSHTKIVAGHKIHTAPVRAIHRINAAHKVTAAHKLTAAHALHAKHSAHKSTQVSTAGRTLGITSMHSGRTGIVAGHSTTIHKATAAAHASVKPKFTSGYVGKTSSHKVTARASTNVVSLSAIAPKKSTLIAHKTTAPKVMNMQ